MKKRIEKLLVGGIKIGKSDMTTFPTVKQMIDIINALIEAQEEMEKDIKQLQVVVEVQDNELYKIRNADLKPVSEPKELKFKPIKGSKYDFSEPKEECICCCHKWGKKPCDECSKYHKPIKSPDHTELREEIIDILLKWAAVDYEQDAYIITDKIFRLMKGKV